MLQMLLSLIQLAAVVILGFLAVGFTIAAILHWRRRKHLVIYGIIAITSALFAVWIWSIDLYSAESMDREDLVEAFYSNFGFYPPDSVEEIKLKNVFIYDASGHWMAFTYNKQVLDQIIERDQPLNIADDESAAFTDIVSDFKDNRNWPEWSSTPEGHSKRIYYKEDFLKHTSSEYYLWVDTIGSMVHLHVNYFD